VHPYRENPAGPELLVPAAQLHGPRSIAFAVCSRPDDVLAQMEPFHHPFLVARGRAEGGELREESGFELQGDGLLLTSLRRTADGLEARIVNETAQERSGSLAGQAMTLRPWEIRTLTL
jgi:hypothetical protein